jgi:hypothetical protein
MRCLLIGLLTVAFGSPQAQRARVRNVDFFGTGGIDVQAVRRVLPVHNGDEVAEDQSGAIRDRLSRAVQDTVGHKPTDLVLMCCDERGEISIYVGLGGSNTTILTLLPPPAHSTCLPVEAVHYYEDALAAVGRAIEQGHSSEDDSRGYALSVDPVARAKQLSMHDYAVTHQQLIERALHGCADSKQREAAATLLGYAFTSRSQVAALLRASRDSDEEVRNNAVRALWVLATSNSALPMPANNFVVMLNSGRWTDRNKAGMLLLVLTRSRPRPLLQRLRSEALKSLIEMARWDDPTHAYAYQVILGRIAATGRATKG